MAKSVRWDPTVNKMVPVITAKRLPKSELESSTLHSLPKDTGAKASGVCRNCNTLPSLSGQCEC